MDTVFVQLQSNATTVTINLNHLFLEVCPMTSSIGWLAMSYNVPITPSKNRVYVWRKLKEMGAEYFKHGVAILPHTKQNLQKIRALSCKIREMEGDATIVELRFLDPADEAQMIAAFKKQSANEFRELFLDFARLYEGADGCFGDGREEKEKMRRRYAKAKSRDFFGIEGELDLEGGFPELMADLKKSSKELYRMMLSFFD